MALEGARAKRAPIRPLGEWNQYEIRVQDQNYQISLNGQLVSNFTFVTGGDAQHPDRALPSTLAVPRYIGLQPHTGASRSATSSIRRLPVQAAQPQAAAVVPAVRA